VRGGGQRHSWLQHEAALLKAEDVVMKIELAK
jgi:hypothetical protein